MSRMRRNQSLAIAIFLTLSSALGGATAFLITTGNDQHKVSKISHSFRGKARDSFFLLKYSRDDENDEGFDKQTLDERISKIRLQILEDDLRRPPNTSLSPKEFVEAVLEGIFHNEDPRPDAGFMLFLRCCTPKWASSVLRAIGAPEDYATCRLEAVASSLGTAMSRPNQFAILTGEDEKDGPGSNEKSFEILFPGETLDFLDGTAWINVELRDKTDNSLLVLMGWQLAQRPDGAWLIDQIDWQDYREKYRPGIGRDEWQGTYEGRRR